MSIEGNSLEITHHVAAACRPKEPSDTPNTDIPSSVVSEAFAWTSALQREDRLSLQTLVRLYEVRSLPIEESQLAADDSAALAEDRVTIDNRIQYEFLMVNNPIFMKAVSSLPSERRVSGMLGTLVLRSSKEMGIQELVPDEGLRTQMIFDALEVSPHEVLESLDRVGWQDPAQIIKVLINCAERKGLVASVLELLKGSDYLEDFREDILKACAKTAPRDVVDQLGSFHLKDKEVLKDLAHILAQTEGQRVLDELSVFGIEEGSSEALDMICYCAQFAPHAALLKLECDKTWDPTDLLKVFEAAAPILSARYSSQTENLLCKWRDSLFSTQSGNAIRFCQIVARLGVGYDELQARQTWSALSPRELMDLVLHLIGEGELQLPWGLLQVLPKAMQECSLSNDELMCVFMHQAPRYGVFVLAQPDLIKKLDSSQRFALARLCAESTAKTAKHIDVFQIDSTEQLQELAVSCAKQNLRRVLSNITKFGVAQGTPEALALMCRCAKQSPPDALWYLDGKIEDVATVQAIAKAVIPKLELKSDYEVADLLTRLLLKNFPQGSAAAVEVLGLCLDKVSANYVTQLLKTGVLQGAPREPLRELLLDIATRYPAELANSGVALALEEKSDRLELCLAIAQRDPGAVADHISELLPDDENARLAVAKVCAQRPIIRTEAEPFCLAVAISDFGITDQETLISLAFASSRQSGADTLECLGDFAIEDEAARLRVIEACLMHPDISNNFDQPDLTPMLAEGEDKTRINYLALIMAEQRRHIQAFIDRLPQSPALALLKHYSEQEGPIQASDLVDRLKALGTPFDGFAEEVEALVDKDKSSVPNDRVCWLLKTLALAEHMHGTKGLQWLKDRNVLRSMTAVHRPDLRNKLLLSLAALLKAPQLPQLGSSKWQKAIAWHTPLAVAMEVLRSRGLDAQVAKDFQAAVMASSWEGAKSLKAQQLLQNTLLALTEDPSVDPTFASDLLKRLLPNVPLVDLRSLNTVLLFGAVDLLAEGNSAQAVIVKLLAERLHIDANEVAAAAFASTFGACRNPMAIVEYAANLSTAHEPVLMDALSSLVQMVTQGRFSDRYRLDNNQHLARLHRYDPQLLGRWQEAIPAQSVSALIDSRSEQAVPLKEWFKQRVRLKPQLNLDAHSELKAYLEGDPEAKSRLALTQAAKATEKRQMLKAAGKDSQAKQRVQEAFRSETEKLVTESKLIRLIEEPELTKDSVGKLQELVRMLDPTAPLLTDLDALMQKAEASPRGPKQALMVYDSDDPYDLMLCGTEVHGSCQRHLYSTAQSRGLMGYMGNGWNRVLKVSTGKDEPYQARCMLRLLWDGQRPVLLRERFYHHTANPSREAEAALNEMALRKAAQLGVALVSLDGKGEAYSKPIRALGGPMPYEYSDAAGGLQKRGVYVIDHPQLRLVESVASSRRSPV